MKYNVILADLDDTLFNFSASSRQALRDTFGAMGLPGALARTEEFLPLNQRFWERFERGEIAKNELCVERFRAFFALTGEKADPAEANGIYGDRLWRHRNFMPGCETLLDRLRPACEVYVITNGTTDSQKRRLRASGLEDRFDGVFISEEMGCRKPEKRFFDLIFREIGEEKRRRAIVLGDSLTSDMQGGRNAGLPTCLYGPREKADCRCDYVVEDLLDFPTLIGA